MKKIFRILVVALLLASALLLMTSCGARKSEKSKNEESIKTAESNETDTAIKLETEKKAESNIKITEHITIDDQNETVTKETVYEPIDNTKPASITDPDGKKTDLNNSKKTVRETKQKRNTKTDHSKIVEAKQKSDEKAKLEAIAKAKLKKDLEAKKLAEDSHLEREAWSYWNILWWLIPAVVLYYVWNNRVAIGKKITSIWWV